MSEGLAVLLAVFVALMLLDAPIAFVIGIATVMAAWALGYNDVLISVARDQFGTLIEKNAPVAMKIIMAFSRRMRYLDEALTRLTT